RVEGGGVLIEVADTGEGLADWQIPLVFEPFWRGDAARSSPGSGLGLALARRVVEHLGGGIEVESAPGQGARFTVKVPLAAAVSDPRGTPRRPAKSMDGPRPERYGGRARPRAERRP